MAYTITAANSVLMLAIASVFPTPVQIQEFGVDDAFASEMAEIAVTQVGVDGTGVAGWVPREVTMTVTLLASSVSSFTVFEAWIAAMDNVQEVLYANATIVLPAVQRKYTLQKGVLTRYPQMPNVKRTLQQRQFEIKWLPDRGIPAITSGPA